MKSATEVFTLDQLLASLCPIYECGTQLVNRSKKADAILQFISGVESQDKDVVYALTCLDGLALEVRLRSSDDDLYSRLTESLAGLCELIVPKLGSVVREIMTEA